jgi:hypothetical protein
MACFQSSNGINDQRSANVGIDSGRESDTNVSKLNDIKTKHKFCDYHKLVNIFCSSEENLNVCQSHVSTSENGNSDSNLLASAQLENGYSYVNQNCECLEIFRKFPGTFPEISCVILLDLGSKMCYFCLFAKNFLQFLEKKCKFFWALTGKRSGRTWAYFSIWA